MDKRIYMEIFEDIIDHYGDCKRWEIKPAMNECYECWQIDSILTNIRSLSVINRNTTDCEFVTDINTLFGKMDYHYEQKRKKVRKTSVPHTRPKVVRVG